MQISKTMQINDRIIDERKSRTQESSDISIIAQNIISMQTTLFLSKDYN